MDEWKTTDPLGEFDPTSDMRAYIDRLPLGSYGAITHFSTRMTRGHCRSGPASCRTSWSTGTVGSGYVRPREEIATMFYGLEFLNPGLTLLPDWWARPPGNRHVARCPATHAKRCRPSILTIDPGQLPLANSAVTGRNRAISALAALPRFSVRGGVTLLTA